MTVSVVIPTFNGEQFLQAAVESVFAQTRLPEEIVVVDDCSNDETCCLVESLANDSPVPMRLIRRPENSGGPAQPLNVGVAAASSEMIAVLDQDDVLHSEKLARQAGALEADPTLSIAFGWCGLGADNVFAQSEESRNEIVACGVDRGDHYVARGIDLLRCLVMRGNFLIGYPAFMFRRASWIEKRGVDESLRIASDMDILGHLFACGDAAIIDMPAYYRREHEDNACRRRAEMHAEGAMVRVRLWKGNSALYGDSEASAALRERVETLAYWFREGGEYRYAKAMLQLANCLGGSKRVFLERRLKTAIHRFASLLGWKSAPNALTHSSASTGNIRAKSS